MLIFDRFYATRTLAIVTYVVISHTTCFTCVRILMLCNFHGISYETTRKTWAWVWVTKSNHLSIGFIHLLIVNVRVHWVSTLLKYRVLLCVEILLKIGSRPFFTQFSQVHVSIICLRENCARESIFFETIHDVISRNRSSIRLWMNANSIRELFKEPILLSNKLHSYVGCQTIVVYVWHRTRFNNLIT